MKKYSAFIINNNEEKKELSVFLDDKTATALDEANNESVTRAYIIDEYHDNLITRK